MQASVESRTGVWALLAVLALLPLCAAHAHGVEADALPWAPGWRLGAGLSVQAVSADEPWPVPRHSGVLLTGQNQADRRDALHLEQASLGLGLRWTGWLGAELAASAHDGDAAHIDTARLETLHTVAGGQLRASLGRQTLSLGPVVDAAGSFDRFAQAPLAKLAAFDSHWSDDGLSLQWQQPEERGLQVVEAGLWRARSFPGGPAGPLAPSLRLGWGWDHWSLQGFGAWLQPRSRGAAALASAGSGHSHGVPDCRTSLHNRVCFDGHTQVLGASLGADGLFNNRFSLYLAGLLRRDHGQLYSSNATADTTGLTSGLWLDAVWTPNARWQLAARLERLAPRHTLSGTNVQTLADAAGLSQAHAVRRATLALGHTVWQPLTLWLELGAEQVADGQQAAQPWLGVRLRWLLPGAAAGSW